MGNHHHEGDSKSFIMPAFLAFALVFCLFVLMSRCHGPFVVGGHGNAGAHGTEQHSGGAHEAKPHEEHATEHKTGDTTEHKSTDTAGHKTEAHAPEHH